MSPTSSCFKCSKATTSLKKCAKCYGVSYCSKSCQKADWKMHKKVCAHLAAARANGVQLDLGDGNGGTITNQATVPDSEVLSVAIKYPFRQLQALTWMHDRSEKDVFKLLVDSWNLRKVKEYATLRVTEIIDADANATDGMVPFRDYVVDAAKKGLLPSWWTKGKVVECIAYGLDDQNWSNLKKWTDEKSLIMHYGPVGIILQLNLFAYQVLGSIMKGGDFEYKAMLKMHVALEARRYRG